MAEPRPPQSTLQLGLSRFWDFSWVSGHVRIKDHIKMVRWTDNPKTLLLWTLFSKHWQQVITELAPPPGKRRPKYLLRAHIRAILSLTGAAQKSQEWLDFRALHITGSELASILGCGCGGGGVGAAFRNKVGLGERFRGNQYTEWGNFYEDEAIGVFSKLKGERCFTDLPCIAHKAIPFLAASPDFVTASGWAGEVKCPPKRPITDEVPKYYYPQLQLVMEVLDLDWCFFVQYRPAIEEQPMVFSCVEVARDRVWFAEKLPHMTQFYHDVEEYRKSGFIPDRYQLRPRTPPGKRAALLEINMDDMPIYSHTDLWARNDPKRPRLS